MRYLFNDFKAGLAVFIVSVPMCLGVATASQGPLQAGIVSGIIGGVVVGLLSGSQVNITGPSPAMIAVVCAAMLDLKDYSLVLDAVIISGVIQVLIGMGRMAKIGQHAPSSVISGFLCGTGLILIFNQIPQLFGYNVISTGDFAFFKDGYKANTVKIFLESFTNMHAGPTIISTLCIVLFVSLNRLSKRLSIKTLPYPILIMVLGTAISVLFSFFGDIFGTNLSPDQFIQLPTGELSLKEEIMTFISTPDLSNIFNKKVLYHAIIIAIAASGESALSVEAATKIDTQRRHVSLNREMMAQGVGNVVCGFVGGLPLAAAIVRTSVSVDSGSKTKKATIISGLLLIIAALAPNVLNMVPESALASILVISGYKLVVGTSFKEVYRRGPHSYIPFSITLLTIFFGTILEGIFCGVCASAFFILSTNRKSPFKSISEQYGIEEAVRIKLPQSVSFLQRIAFIEILQALPKGSSIIIDASDSHHIDYDVLDTIKEFEHFYAPANNIKVTLTGFDEKYGVKNSPMITTITKEQQSKMTPEQVLSWMIAGNKRFVRGDNIYHSVVQQRHNTSRSQHPMVIILSCMDSRSSPDLIFDLGIGDAMGIRVAGNIVNADIISSIEYACAHLGTKLIVVLGHTSCGAVTAACGEYSKADPGHRVLDQIKPMVKRVDEYFFGEHLVAEVVKMNTFNSVNDIKKSTIIQKLLHDETVKIVPAVYNISTGVVDFMT